MDKFKFYEMTEEDDKKNLTTESKIEEVYNLYSKEIASKKEEIIKRIEFLHANKCDYPLPIPEYKIIIRPLGMKIYGHINITFDSTYYFFESNITKLISDMLRIYNDKDLVLEFKLYPYEYGNKKLVSDLYLRNPASQQNPQPLPETSQISEKAENNENEILTIHDITRDSIQDYLPPSLRSNIFTPTKEKTAMMLDIARFTEDFEKAMNSEINYANASWGLPKFSRSTIKIRHVLDANRIYTPQQLIKSLGTLNPTKADWMFFIDKLNLRVLGKAKIKDQCSNDLRNWLLMRKIIK